MMDTCADYYSNLSGPTNTTNTTPSRDDDRSDRSNSLSASSAASIRNSSPAAPSNVHPLLQHTTHPQHLIAPVAPQLAAPPAAIVAPTITNHHPQQPGKFTHGGGYQPHHGATTGYLASATSSVAVGAQSVVNGTSTGGHHNQLQATVYPIQHQQQQSKNPSPLLLLDNFKASVITENPYDTVSYHGHNQQQQQKQQGNSSSTSSYTVSSSANSLNLWSPTGSGRVGDQLVGVSANNGYLESRTPTSFNGSLSGHCGAEGGSGLGGGESALEYSLHGYGDNGLTTATQGTNSNLGGYGGAIYQSNYGGAEEQQGGVGGGGGGSIQTTATISTTPTMEGHGAVLDYHQSSGSGSSSKCTYNSNTASSSPVISSQTATSPFHFATITQHQQQQQQQQQHQVYQNGNNSGGGGVGGGGSSLHGLTSNAVLSSPSGRMNNHNNMRTNHSFDPSNPLEYQHYPPVQGSQMGSVASLDAMTQRTYMDLSASKPQSNPSSYYPPQNHMMPQKSKRYYEDTTPQYVMPESNGYAYNGYKTHPSSPHASHMPSHPHQMSRAHYQRQGSGALGSVPPAAPQIDPKLYRRTYAKHSNYPYHQYSTNGSSAAVYGTDPLAGKRLANYYPPAAHPQTMHPSGYSEQQMYEMEAAKKKSVAYQTAGVGGGKYPYSYLPHPASVSNGQYGMIPATPHGNARPTCNYYPNGYMNYPMAATHQAQKQPHQSGTGYYGNNNMGASGGGSAGAEMYSHSNYLKPPPPRQMLPHQMDASPMAKLNRNCYYETNVPPAGEKTYVDLEDQIAGSKVAKSRVVGGYPLNLDYHHQPYYGPPPQTHAGHHHHPAMPPYPNAKFQQERFLYHQHLYSQQQQQQQQQSHQPGAYYPGMTGSMNGPGLHHSQSHLGHSHLLHGDPAQYLSNGKNINVRDFLSSWNDDEEEAAGGGCGGGVLADNYQQGGQFNNLQRIQVGISIDKSSLMDSTGTMNLPDIIVDIEKQKPVIPEIDLTDDGIEEGKVAEGGSGGGNSSAAEERLYVLESINVPLSELNKYKHLNVINKLPENIVHLKEGAESELLLFNESDLMHSGGGGNGGREDATVVTTSDSVGSVAASGVENSEKFIEEIDSNYVFKNDFELNVEYESFPTAEQKVLLPEVTSSTSPSSDQPQDIVVKAEPSLAELVTKAEDKIASQRKESVIVAMSNRKKLKSESEKRKRLKKALKAQRKKLKEEEEKEKREESATKGDEVDSESETVKPANQFKTLVKCCLEVINTKHFRRNANKYLPHKVVEWKHEPVTQQRHRPVQGVPRKHLDRKSAVRKLQPKSLREICAERVISLNLVTIQEDYDETDEGGKEMLITIDGQVPLLRDLCEQVLSQNNFIINMEDFCELEGPQDLIPDKPSSSHEDSDSRLDDNNNNHLPLISGLSASHMDIDSSGGSLRSVVDAPEFPLTANNPDLDEMSDLPSAAFDPYQDHHQDALMSCDYFLTEPEDGDPIQFSEEVVPCDPDQHKRKLLTEQLRLKYVHNNHTNHALDCRRVTLKKYFYYQRHVAMVSRGRWRSRCKAGALIAVLKTRYSRAMRCRLERWSKRSKTFLLAPPQTPAVIVQQRKPSPTIHHPISINGRVEPPTDEVGHSKATAPANNETILKLIKEGIADMARKAAVEGGEDTRDDKSDIEVIMGKAAVEEKRVKSSGDKKGDLRDDRKFNNKRVASDKDKPAHNQRHPHPPKTDHPKNNSYCESMSKVKEGESGKRRTESEREVLPRSEPKKVSKESRPRETESEVEDQRHPKKKIKPKFDDILLGIDDIYKAASSPVTSKVKPKLWKAPRAFEVLELSDSSVSSPSSVLSSSTTSSSSSSSSTSSSSSSRTSSSTTSSEASVKHASKGTAARSIRSSSGSSTDSTSRRRSSSNSSRKSSTSARSTKGKGTERKEILVKEKVTQYLAPQRAKGTEEGPKVQHSWGKRLAGVRVEEKVKNRLIIKTAVVQLERDGYIDNLGKLYT